MTRRAGLRHLRRQSRDPARGLRRATQLGRASGSAGSPHQHRRATRPAQPDRHTSTNPPQFPRSRVATPAPPHRTSRITGSRHQRPRRTSRTTGSRTSDAAGPPTNAAPASGHSLRQRTVRGGRHPIRGPSRPVRHAQPEHPHPSRCRRKPVRSDPSRASDGRPPAPDHQPRRDHRQFRTPNPELSTAVRACGQLGSRRPGMSVVAGTLETGGRRPPPYVSGACLPRNSSR